MKSNYYEIYNEILALYRRRFGREPYWRFRPSETVQLDFLENAIFDIEEKIGKRLRPDARLFLLANFHLMIMLPMTHPMSTTSAEELTDAIRSDIHSIVNTAAEKSINEPDVSGGAILRATAQLWNTLKTNAQNIWT